MSECGDITVLAQSKMLMHCVVEVCPKVSMLSSKPWPVLSHNTTLYLKRSISVQPEQNKAFTITGRNPAVRNGVFSCQNPILEAKIMTA